VIRKSSSCFLLKLSKKTFIEEYKDGYIAYSLGNFVFDQFFSEETARGLILRALIEDGRIKDIKPIEIKISEFFQAEFISE